MSQPAFAALGMAIALFAPWSAFEDHRRIPGDARTALPATARP